MERETPIRVPTLNERLVAYYMNIKSVEEAQTRQEYFPFFLMMGQIEKRYPDFYLLVKDLAQRRYSIHMAAAMIKTIGTDQSQTFYDAIAKCAQLNNTFEALETEFRSFVTKKKDHIINQMDDEVANSAQMELLKIWNAFSSETSLFVELIEGVYSKDDLDKLLKFLKDADVQVNETYSICCGAIELRMMVREARRRAEEREAEERNLDGEQSA